MAGTLRVVATPIGNLGDLSPRATQSLASADLVLCEDTRHSGALLHHLGLKKPCWSLHAHNEEGQLAAVLDALRGGQTVALVSDAGTPCLSDPGALLVRAVQAAGIAVESVPGPFAAAVALAGSGLCPVPFAFWGFLAKKSAERRTQLQARLHPGPQGAMTHAFYVPGRDIGDVLADVQAVAPAARLCVARELTKIHEEFLIGTAADLVARWTPEQARGEAVLLVEVDAGAAGQRWGTAQVTALIVRAQEAGQRTKQAVPEIAQQAGWSRNEVYDLWLAIAAAAQPED